MNSIVTVVLVLIIVSLASVVVCQQMRIDSLEYSSGLFSNQSSEFAEEIHTLKNHLTVACAYRTPSYDNNARINWTKVCGE